MSIPENGGFDICIGCGGDIYVLSPSPYCEKCHDAEVFEDEMDHGKFDRRKE